MTDQCSPDSETLLPCPFCNGAVQFRKALHVSDGNVDSVIHAAPTNCPMVVFEDGSTDQSVLIRWNTRVAAAQPVTATDAMCEAAINSDAPDCIRGFTYPTHHVIRDVWADRELWSRPIDIAEYTPEYVAFQRQVEIERMRRMLEAALAVSSTLRPDDCSQSEQQRQED